MSDGLRWVRCHCGSREVITRRGPDHDHLCVCSVRCWESRIDVGIESYPGQRRYLETGQRAPKF